MKHLELFAGIGGFRRALDLIQCDTGIPMECVGYSEIDERAKQSYKAIFDIKSEVDMGDIVAYNSNPLNIESLPDFELLTGGFPCQSFSMMGKQKGFEDARGTMFFELLKILEIKRPKYILLENVKNLFTHDKKRTFSVIKDCLERLGYNVYYDIFNTHDFHLAQIRNRVLIFGSLESTELKFNSKTISKYFSTIIDECSVLKQENVIDVLYSNVPEKYFLSDRIKPTILSNGSGNFKSNSEINQIVARPLTASMHKMHRACQDNYYSQDFIDSKGNVNVAKTMSKEELCRQKIRKLTPQEAFMLQGFSCELCEKALLSGVSDGALYHQAGNAVSVNVIYAIIRYLIINNLIQK